MKPRTPESDKPKPAAVRQPSEWEWSSPFGKFLLRLIGTRRSKRWSPAEFARFIRNHEAGIWASRFPEVQRYDWWDMRKEFIDWAMAPVYSTEGATLKHMGYPAYDPQGRMGVWCAGWYLPCSMVVKDPGPEVQVPHGFWHAVITEQFRRGDAKLPGMTQGDIDAMLKQWLEVPPEA